MIQTEIAIRSCSVETIQVKIKENDNWRWRATLKLDAVSLVALLEREQNRVDHKTNSIDLKGAANSW